MLVLPTAACDDPRPPRLPRAAILRDAPVVLYRATDPTRPARAAIFFFGNDVGFWKPHQALAWQHSGMQYAVAEFDIRQLLAKLPDASGGRDSVFASTMRRLIDSARAERGPTPPLILSGHSIGSELALWTAAHVPLHGLTGVLALSPGSRSHLDISASDLLMSAEPTGPLSFLSPNRSGRFHRPSVSRSFGDSATSSSSPIPPCSSRDDRARGATSCRSPDTRSRVVLSHSSAFAKRSSGFSPVLLQRRASARRSVGCTDDPSACLVRRR